MTQSLAHCAPAARQLPRRVAPARPATRLMQMIALWRQRSALREMDDAQLCDLGLSRAEADAEARRPVWDVPAHWQR